MAVTGTIFGVQRFSIHDGPGIRTVLFLKGCNMRCAWCHNPEGLDFAPALSWTRDRCTLCAACAAACARGVHRFSPEHLLDRERCLACGECVKACPNGALAIVGRKIDSPSAAKELLRDRRYYLASGGGITLSGGEALCQAEFAVEVLRECRRANVHCALETNGACEREAYREALPYVDLFLFDYKISDPCDHERYTGVARGRVLDSLGWLYGQGARILLRCPVIPGVNDTGNHLRAIARLTREYPALLGAQVLPYHALGLAKARRLGLEAREYAVPGELDAAGWKAQIARWGGKVCEDAAPAQTSEKEARA